MSRESFETWYNGKTKNNEGVAYYADIKGRYCFDDIELAWQAWEAQQSRIDELEALIEKIKAPLLEAKDLAMLNVVAARIPESGDFGFIAQDLDYISQELGYKNEH